MRRTDITLDTAKEAFLDQPNNKSAASYMLMLLQYSADDMIGDDTFLDGLAEIQEYLDMEDK